MKDSYGRELTYLRISLTDRCDLRCRYCMPPCGVENIPHDEILRSEEIYRIVSVMVGMGITKVRLTGGEPLVRRDITGLIQMLGSIDRINKLCITTNGVKFAAYADELKKSGINDVNMSLDTLNENVFCELTGKNELKSVLESIEKAYGIGMHIKLNCVPIKDINENELADIAYFAKERPIDVRFIELMPIGCGRKFTGISSETVMKRLESIYGKAEREVKAELSSPAVMYTFKGFSGKVGTISPISHKFCASCSRLRLTSDGFLKLCLQYPVGIDLKKPLRSGCTDDELKSLILGAIQKKPYAHSFCDSAVGDTRKMVQIGG